MAWNLLDWLEIAGMAKITLNGWNWLYMAEMAKNGEKKWLEKALNNWNSWKWLDMSGKGWNGWKLLEMAGNVLKGLERLHISENGG